MCRCIQHSVNWDSVLIYVDKKHHAIPILNFSKTPRWNKKYFSITKITKTVILHLKNHNQLIRNNELANWIKCLLAWKYMEKNIENVFLLYKNQIKHMKLFKVLKFMATVVQVFILFWLLNLKVFTVVFNKCKAFPL